MYELTAFKNIFDNKTRCVKAFGEWDDFVKALYQMSKIKGYKPARGERRIPKHASPLITPAIFEPGSTRSNDNVLYWANWAALDIDDYEGDIKDVLKLFKDYTFVCYSSASSRKEHPKFRMVLRLTERVVADDIGHFWFALNKEFNNVNDEQTKDKARMYYVPAKYPNAYNFIFSNEGKKVDPDTIMSKHSYVEEKKTFIEKLPKEMQKAIIQSKLDDLDRTDITWTNIDDCPFVSKKMIRHFDSIAHIDNSGRYSYFYKIMLNIAGNAINSGYPITPSEIETLLRQLDARYGSRYKRRPLALEASRALNFVLKHK
jgi:hypothetical protein